MSERSGSVFRCCAAVALALIVVVALAGCTPRVGGSSTAKSAPPTAVEKEIIASINKFRAAHGLHALVWEANISDKAKLWAAWMAGGNCPHAPNAGPTICHSNLTSGITVHWSLLEENVGAATPKTNVAGLMSGFQHSKEHAANMLNGKITAIGIGAAYSGNTIFVAEEFMAS